MTPFDLYFSFQELNKRYNNIIFEKNIRLIMPSTFLIANNTKYLFDNSMTDKQFDLTKDGEWITFYYNFNMNILISCCFPNYYELLKEDDENRIFTHTINLANFLVELHVNTNTIEKLLYEYL